MAVFAPLKAAYRDNVERLERGGVNTVGKEHFTSLYSHARERAFTRRNILAGWSKAGLFPFNPSRVLHNLPRPTHGIVNVEGSETTPQQQGSTTPPPLTPVTPASTEAFSMLQNLTVAQYASQLNDTSKRNLQRHLQKFAKGTGAVVAKTMLQEDQISFLLRTNNEAKVRRTTKLLVLGNAKVMSFEDLAAAGVKRAERDVVRTNKKGKCGRKRQIVAGGAAMSQIDEERDQPGTGNQITESPPPPNIVVAEPWRAPVARMV